MGGGGNFFQQIANTVTQAVATVVNPVSNAVGAGDVINTKSNNPEPKPNPVQARPAESAQTLQTEGGTPTSYASQGSKQAGSAAALSGNQQAVNQSAGSGTLLTGNQGVDPLSLELGKKTLLGG